MFGQNLRKILKEKKLTSRELAAVIGVSETYVSFLLTGKKNPSMKLLRTIGQFLALDPAELVKESEPPANDGLEALAKKYAPLLQALESMNPDLVADLTARIEAAASLFPPKDAPKTTGQGGASYSRRKRPG